MGPVTQHAPRKGLRLRRWHRLLAAGAALATIAAAGVSLRIAGAAGQPVLGPAQHTVYAVDGTSGKVMLVAPGDGTLIRTGSHEPFSFGPRLLAFSPGGATGGATGSPRRARTRRS
jgi:hypothetical protein